jgi:hypothetical protein
MRSALMPALVLAGLLLAGPARAQGAAGTPAPTTATQAQPPAPVQPPVAAAPAPKAMEAPDLREIFMTGLRRVGVMAGQVVQCSTTPADRQAQISQAMDLANQIAVHFGLRAAFNFVGALGYGSGKPFDKAGCARAIDGWKEIAAKYLNQ